MSKKRRAATRSSLAVNSGSPQRQPHPAQLFSRAAILQAGAFALIFAATIIAYWPSMHGTYLWDDENHVTSAEQSLHGLWRIWTHLGPTAQYYPVLLSAFWFERRLWGDDMLGFHLTTVVLHAAAACLLVLLVRRFELPGAWLAGFVFALHPVCVEGVAWICEQKSTLSAVLCFSSTLAYLDFDRSRSRSRYFLAFALFALAVLAKTVIVTLPAALLVIFWWQRGRLSWKRDVFPLLPWFAFGIGGGALTSWVERVYLGADGADYSLTLLQHVLLACRDIWFYAGKLVWPANLIFIYPRWTISTHVWWQYLFPIGILAVLILFAWIARRGSPGSRGPMASLLIFAGTLFPALGFINVYPFRYSYVSDHYQYLASVAVIVPLSVALALLSRRLSSLPPWLPPASAACLLAVLGILTWRQTFMYRDSQTFYRVILARNPDAWMAHNNLAYLLLNVPGGLPEAVSHLETAIRLHPDYAEAYDNLGIVYSMKQQWQQAAVEYQVGPAHRSHLRTSPDQSRRCPFPHAGQNGRSHLGVRDGLALQSQFLGDALRFRSCLDANPRPRTRGDFSPSDRSATAAQLFSGATTARPVAAPMKKGSPSSPNAACRLLNPVELWLNCDHAGAMLTFAPCSRPVSEISRQPSSKSHEDRIR